MPTSAATRCVGALLVGAGTAAAAGNHGQADHGHSYEAGVAGHHFNGDPCLQFDKKLCERTSACEWRRAAEHKGSPAEPKNHRNPSNRHPSGSQGVGDLTHAGYKGSEDEHCAAIRPARRDRNEVVAAKITSFGMHPKTEDAVCGEFFSKQDCKYANQIELEAFRPKRCQWNACGGNGVSQPYCGNVDEVDNHGHRKHGTVWEEISDMLDLPCFENPYQYCAGISILANEQDDDAIFEALFSLQGPKSFPPYLRGQIESPYARCMPSACEDGHMWFYDGVTTYADGASSHGMYFGSIEAAKGNATVFATDRMDPLPTLAEAMCHSITCDEFNSEFGSQTTDPIFQIGQDTGHPGYGYIDDVADVVKVYDRLVNRLVDGDSFCARTNDSGLQAIAVAKNVRLCTSAPEDPVSMCPTPTPTPTPTTPTPTPTPTPTTPTPTPPTPP